MKQVWLIVLALRFASPIELAASPHAGQVTFGGLPVPGAVVSAIQNDQKLVTVTDSQGLYQFADLSDGMWTIRVEMLGFSAINQDVQVAAGAEPSIWSLTLRPFAEIAALAGPAPAEITESTTAAAAPADSAARNGAAASPPGPSPGTDPDLAQRAADGLLVNGSVNNGAASPFAQLAAFGNNRRGIRSLYNGGVGIILGNSAFDARSFSFDNAQNTPKPIYSDAQFAGTFGGPIRIPGLVNRPNVFALFQHTSDHTANTQPARMPTALERRGDFSGTRDAFGQAVEVRDPMTGLPFPGGVIPRDRISSQAAALLGYYPLPNLDTHGQYNYQRPLVTAMRQDNVQTRITQPGFGRNQLSGSFAYQRTKTDAFNVFAFENATEISGMDGAINWSRRFDVTLLQYGVELQATRFDVDTEAGTLTTSRPGGVLWPRVDNGKLRIVISYTSAYTETAREATRKKLKIGWTTSHDDTSHTSLSSSGGRNYVSSTYGMQRKDWAA